MDVNFVMTLGAPLGGSGGDARPPSPAASPATAARASFAEMVVGERRVEPGVPIRLVDPGTAGGPGAQQGLTKAGGWRRTLDDMLAGERRVDALLRAAQGGKAFSAGQLLAMQATVFRHAQTVEVISRATDRLVGAVKQTLATPV